MVTDRWLTDICVKIYLLKIFVGYIICYYDSTCEAGIDNASFNDLK